MTGILYQLCSKQHQNEVHIAFGGYDFYCSFDPRYSFLNSLPDTHLSLRFPHSLGFAACLLKFFCPCYIFFLETVRFRSLIQFRSMILVVTLHRW